MILIKFYDLNSKTCQETKKLAKNYWIDMIDPNEEEIKSICNLLKLEEIDLKKFSINQNFRILSKSKMPPFIFLIFLMSLQIMARKNIVLILLVSFIKKKGLSVFL